MQGRARAQAVPGLSASRRVSGCLTACACMRRMLLSQCKHVRAGAGAVPGARAGVTGRAAAAQLHGVLLDVPRLPHAGAATGRAGRSLRRPPLPPHPGPPPRRPPPVRA